MKRTTAWDLASRLLNMGTRFQNGTPKTARERLLTLYFWAVLSAEWRDQRDNLSMLRGKARAAAEARIEASDGLKMPAGSSLEDVCRAIDDRALSSRVLRALEAVERANPDLAGLFGHLAFAPLESAPLESGPADDRALAALLGGFIQKGMDLRPAHLKDPHIHGQVFRSVEAVHLERTLGQGYTSPDLARLLAELIGPRPGERICDPACGVGQLLFACTDLPIDDTGTSQAPTAYYGQDPDAGNLAMARIHTRLSGSDALAFTAGDALYAPKQLCGRKLQTYHAMLTNAVSPALRWDPARGELDPWRRFARGVPSKSKPGLALVFHILASLEAKVGRAAVATTTGPLFRAAEAKIRQALIRENAIDAVIALPKSIVPGAKQDTVVLVLAKNRAAKDVLFIKVADKPRSDAQRKEEWPDLTRMIVHCVRGRHTVPGFSKTADPDEIAANRLELTPRLYVEPAVDHDEPPEHIPGRIEQLKREQENIEAELKRLQKLLNEAVAAEEKGVEEKGVE